MEHSGMKTAGRVAAMLAFALICGTAIAQDEGPRIQIGGPQINQQRMTATVTGRVTCADTQRAARFATVTLIGTASAIGYASPVAESAARLRSGASAADLLATMPQVHVAEAGGGTANITLDRGGVIAGRLQWDDGTPATGVNLSVQSTASSTGGPTDVTRVVSQLGGGFGAGL